MTSLWLLNVGRKQNLSFQILCVICRKVFTRGFSQTCALNARERQVGLTIEETTKRKILEGEWPVKNSVREIPITNLKEDEDFFGIESDSGCIIVPEKTEKLSVEKIRYHLRKRERTADDERTIVTTFGSVRFDSDNQQLNEDPKAKFCISGISDETDSLKKFYDLFYPNGQTREEFKPLSANVKLKCKHLDPQIVNTCVDKVLEVLPDNTTIAGKEKSSEISQKEDSANYMDICYFGNELLNMTEVDSKIYKTEEDFSVDSLSAELSETCNEDLEPSNFIDDFYFGNNSLSSSEVKNYSDTDMYVHTKEEELNYVDNIYFHDLYGSELHKDIKNSKGNKRKENVTSSAELYDLKSNFNADEAVGNWKQHLKECQANLSNLNISGVQSNGKDNGIESNDIDFRGSLKKVEDQMDLNESSNACDRQTVKPFEHLRYTENRELLDLSQNEDLTSSQLCSLNDVESGSATDQYSSQISEFAGDRKRFNFKKATPKDSRTTPKTSGSLKSNLENKNSAYNYIVKLRNEHETETNNTDKGIVDKAYLPGEKLDSKGFRILKDQTTDLTRKTPFELLDMMKERILFSNDDVIIVDKPYGLIIHDSETVKQPSFAPLLKEFAHQLDKSSIDPQLYTVHRLDKETTGCLILARNEKAAAYLKALFVNRKISKTYWIVTSNIPEPPRGIIDMPIAEGKIDHKVRMVIQPDLPPEIKYKSHVKKGKRAVTHYEVIATSGNAALVEVKPETGLKHQIRVHFGFGLGCPIIGDHKYSHLTKLVPQRLPNDILQKLHIRQSKVRYVPMHIHAKSIVIQDYFEKGRDLHVTCPLPKHMSVNLRRLKFKKK